MQDPDALGRVVGAPGGPVAPVTDFPLLSRQIEGRRLVYLDSAATTLKPTSVIDAVTNFYRHSCANVHRGDHTLSQEASELFEEARSGVAQFIGASAAEVVFTANATEGLNMVAHGLELGPGDNVITSVLDHHSNILPWMQHCEVRYLPLSADGVVEVEALGGLIDAKTRLVALSHVSNVTGAINDVGAAISVAHDRGVPVVIDGSQSVPHLRLDVVELGCDFLVFSGHKMLGPSGVGVLYIESQMSDRLRPLKLGGGSPDHVRRDGFTLKEMPYRHEAGTPNIEGVIGLGAAIEYLENVGMDRVAQHDAQLSRQILETFSDMPGLRLMGPADPDRRIAIASLVPTDDNITVMALGHMLSDSFKVMARSGTHCAHPLFDSLGLPGSLRLSAYVYNGVEDLEIAATAIAEILGTLG